MTDPMRVSLTERRDLIDRTVDMVRGLKDRSPGSEVVYLTMFPRHVTRCCKARDHMTEDDCMTMLGFRRGVDSEVVEELVSGGVGVRVVDWWETLGWAGEGTLNSLRAGGIVGEDGVHLSVKANSTAALFFCHRLAEMELQHEEGGGKRRRLL